MRYVSIGLFYSFLTRLVVVCCLLVISITATAKDITRTCKAGINVKHPSGTIVAVERFDSESGCGSNVPNRCRERARKKAHKCVGAHWKARWERKTPAECKDGGIHNYDTRDLKWKLENKACNSGWGKHTETQVSLIGWTKGNTDCSGVQTLTNKYVITPAMCAKALNTSPPPRRTPDNSAIRIPANDKRDSKTGLMFPASMPKIRWPKGYNGCSANEKSKIQKWWAMGHYMTWIADMYMDWMAKNDKYRVDAWNHSYRKPLESNGWRNYAPRGWFGGYSKKNFDIADGTIERLWKKRFLERTFTVKCRTNDSNRGAHPCFRSNPGGNGTPSANHIVLGTINFCNKSFEEKNGYSEALSNNLGGRLVVHELLHWLRTPNGRIVQDTHTHCHGAVRCPTEKGYGTEKASHLANYEGGGGTKNAKKRRRVAHRKRALRNNDNYAWFIYYLGSMAYHKKEKYGLPKVTQLPPSSFNW